MAEHPHAAAPLLPLPSDALGGAQRAGLLVGGAGLVIGVAGVLLGATPDQFFRSYLIGFMFCLGIALGSLAIAMLHHLTGGGWGMVSRRTLEAAARTLPLLALYFLPIAIFGMRPLYLWARPDAVAADAILQAKTPYLNLAFFFARAAFYFIVWILLALTLTRWSREQDEAGLRPIGTERKFRFVSAAGLLLYAMTITFASIDWVMSLDPHWFSTIFGILFMGGQGLSALAFVIIVLATVHDLPPLAGVIRPLHFHDLGKLMFAFVMLWAYFSFSQFLIIWSGNLPEEIPWYLERMRGVWGYLAVALVLLQFAAPFLLLLSRDIKRNPRLLRNVAVVVLAMRFFDLLWLIKPGAEGLSLHWMDLVVPAGLFGLWLFVFVGQVRRRPALPVYDPYFAEAMAVHGGH
ncbi:MAG TPA: hypothetical protein VK886_21415 [Vicinamibacterales bacterium]|nr:hypothetical protein [Vicinamibacterales bacterium]